VTLTRLTDFVRCDILSQLLSDSSFNGYPLCRTQSWRDSAEPPCGVCLKYLPAKQFARMPPTDK
jgi:hypothetical protein